MSRLVFAFITALAMAATAAAQATAPAAAPAGTWQIDPNHTAPQFSVRHLGVSTVRGVFAKTTGSAHYDPADPAKTSLDATIDVSSLDTRVEMRNNDLRSPHFFDAAKYPTITFHSKSTKVVGPGKLLITGDLTIHGVTKEVVLDVDGPSAPIKDPMGKGQRIGASAATKIIRQDFGIDAAPGVVGDEINIIIDVELTLAPSTFNTTPNGVNGADGGIWGGGGAPAVDSGNDVYVATGNGVFDQGSGMTMENDYGDSVLRLQPFTGSTPNGVNLSLAGYFTPDTESCLATNDTDLGSGAPVILPDQTAAGLPSHLLVQLGKDGFVYLLDRDNMGQFQTNNCLDTSTQILQSFQGTGGFWGTLALWQNNIYFAGAGDVLKQFTFEPGTGFNTNPSSQSIQNFGFPDVSPSVSSQGASNGIVWAVDAGLYGYASPNAAGGINCYVSPVPAPCTGPAVLHAYSATNLANEYWNSAAAANNRDQAGNAVKFVPPTIANGKVYVSTRTEVDVYGLLPN